MNSRTTKVRLSSVTPMTSSKIGRKNVFTINETEYSIDSAKAEFRKIRKKILDGGEANSKQSRFIASAIIPYKNDVADPLCVTVGSASGFGYGDRDFCFYYKTKRGCWDDFSFNNLLKTKSQKHRDRVRESFRYEVWDEQIKPIRVKNGMSFDEHVDHKFSMTALIGVFIKENGLKVEDVDVEFISGHAWARTRIKDRDLANKWKGYHGKHAILTPVSATENYAKMPIDKAVCGTMRSMGLMD